MVCTRRAVFLLLATSLPVGAHRANPIRRVVDMLQSMSDKAAETKMPQVTSALKEAEAEHARLGQELAGKKADRADAKKAIDEATALRQKEANLADITSTEQTAIQDYESMVAAREKEIASAGAAVEAKLAREGEVGENIVMMKEDLDDTGKAYVEDQKFLANLDKTCADKTAEWEVIQKTRTEELLAIADTIKILNDDDALELFKKTLPSPSFLQTLANTRATTQQALKALHGNKDSRVELISITLRGGAKNFDKVLGLIDDMVALLGDEQKSDDKKKSILRGGAR